MCCKRYRQLSIAELVIRVLTMFCVVQERGPARYVATHDRTEPPLNQGASCATMFILILSESVLRQKLQDGGLQVLHSYLFTMRSDPK